MDVTEQPEKTSKRSRKAAIALGALMLVVAAFGAGAAWMGRAVPTPAAPSQPAAAPVQIVTLHGFVRVRGMLAAPGRSMMDSGTAESCFSWKAPVGEGSPVVVRDAYGQSRSQYLPAGRYQGLFPGNTFADTCIFYFEQPLAANASYLVQAGPYQQQVWVDGTDDYPQVDLIVE